MRKLGTGADGWGAVVSGLVRLGFSGEMIVELRSENKTLAMSWALPISNNLGFH